MKPRPTRLLAPGRPSFLFAALLAGSSLAPSALADTVRVPKDAPTLQAAIDQAQDGDEILVSSGTYTGNVLVDGRADLRIAGKGKVILDGGGQGPALRVIGSTGVRLEKLIFQGGQSEGFRADVAPGLVLFRCQTRDNPGNGLTIDGCDDLVIERCKFVDDGAHAVQVDRSDRARLERNTVLRSGLDGLSLSNGLPSGQGSADVVILKNVIKSAGKDGIDLHGTDGLVQQNRILKPFEDGLEVDSGGTGASTRIELFKNLVRSAGRDGLRLNGADNRAERNTIVKAGNAGIKARGNGGHVVLTNKIMKAGGDGLELKPSANGCTLEGNKISRSLKDGIAIQSTGNTVTGNRVAKSDDNGLHIESSNNTVVDNRCTSSGDYGLHDTTGGNSYSGNVFKSVDPDGFEP